MLVSGMIWVGACVGNIAGYVKSPHRLPYFTLPLLTCSPKTLLLQTGPSAGLPTGYRINPSLQYSRIPPFHFPSIRFSMGES